MRYVGQSFGRTDLVPQQFHEADYCQIQLHPLIANKQQGNLQGEFETRFAVQLQRGDGRQGVG